MATTLMTAIRNGSADAPRVAARVAPAGHVVGSRNALPACSKNSIRVWHVSLPPWQTDLNQIRPWTRLQTPSPYTGTQTAPKTGPARNVRAYVDRLE